MPFIHFKVSILWHKTGGNCFVQIWLITFKGSKILVATTDNQFTSFFWVLMASKSKNNSS